MTGTETTRTIENSQVTCTRMFVNSCHWNACKLVFAGTRIRKPIPCWTHTHVHVNAALDLQVSTHWYKSQVPVC